MFLRRNRCGVWTVVDTSTERRIELTTGTKDRAEAERFLCTFNGGLTIEQSAQRFEVYSRINHKPRTTQRIHYALGSFMKHAGRTASILDVTPETIEAFKLARSGSIRPVSVNSELRHIKLFFSWLERIERRVQYNPVKRVKLLDVPQTQVPVFTIETFHELLKVLPPWAGSFVQFAFATGMRRSEVIWTRWENVDIKRRLVYVRNTDTFQTKTNRERAVPLNELALSALPVERAEGFVFLRDGKQIHYGWITEVFKLAVRKAGLDRRLHLHSLRHSFCTLLLANGASITDVATIAGHASIATTQRYMHLKGETMHHATDLLTRTDRQ